MGSLQQPNKFRLKQGTFLQHGGSETDVSTSNENLSSEEKYVIRHTTRQEPQGQENLQPQSNRNSLNNSLPSNRSSLDASTSSYNTLIIHSAGDDQWASKSQGMHEYLEVPLNYVTLQHSNLQQEHNKQIQKRGSQSPASSTASSIKDGGYRNSYESNPDRIYESEVHEITDIPDDYLSHNSLLKQLAKEVNVPSPNVMDKGNNNLFKFDPLAIENNPVSPIDFASWVDPSNANKNTVKDKYTLSKSQPDLSMIGLGAGANARRGVSVPRPQTRGKEMNLSHSENIYPSGEIVKLLCKENSALKAELEKYYQKAAKTDKLEQEIYKVHRGHEELVKSCDRREQLERAARSKLQSDTRRLQELNRTLRDQVDLLSNQLLSRSPTIDASGPDSLRREFNKREIVIAQLITQNKEFLAAKERQEIELAAQRATLQEQRTHIAILDTALTNAQGNVVRLEEECQKKQIYVERAMQLQRALSSLQMASDRREQTERKLRSQLEIELQRTKADSKMGWNTSNNQENESISELKRQLREKDEKIIRLEGDCSKLEQRYLEESALRQAAIDAASLPKDAKIAALEKTSQESEKIIAEARNEKIRHMDEVYVAQKKVADLESRVTDLESKLAEKEAMIRVLQKRAYDKDVTNMLRRSPHHTPHSSLADTDIEHVLNSRDERVNSVLTSSTGFGSSNSYASSDSSYHMPSYTFDANKFESNRKTLDNQLKEIDSQLDSQLLSKRALCCFPGFTNPVSQRKSKISKPLLSSNNSGLYEATSFLLPSNRQESGEILLLEKQGLTSQQQRMQEPNDSDSKANHCPSPSSLPRPPRSMQRSGLPRRLGEYNRLQESDMPRKKSEGSTSLGSNISSRQISPVRSSVPPPHRKLGEYGRLPESEGSSTSLRKSIPRLRTGSLPRSRNSASTLSNNSASSLPSALPTPSKVEQLFGGLPIRRGSSLGREGKNSLDSAINKYRIQF